MTEPDDEFSRRRRSGPRGARKGTENGNGNGNGRLTEYRLQELERRMGALEDDIGEVTQSCTRIETRLESVASKSQLWQVFAGILGTAVVSLVAHVILRSL